MPHNEDIGQRRRPPPDPPPPPLERSAERAVTAFEAYVAHFLKPPPADQAIERALTAVLETLECLRNQGVQIMSAISDFAAKQKTFNDRTGAAIDGIVADIKVMNDLIEKLQNSPGTITPEDQATLNELEAAGDGVATKAEALDNERPPVVPAG